MQLSVSWSQTASACSTPSSQVEMKVSTSCALFWSTSTAKTYAWMTSCWCCQCEHHFSISHFSTESPFLRSFNDSDVPHNFLSSISKPNFTYCSTSSASSLMFLSFTCISSFVLVPLSSLVLFTAIQRQRQRTSTMTTNYDLISYNILALELINLPACGIYLVGRFTFQPVLMKTGLSAVYFVFDGRLLFHCLTCVEQYVAVMHPIIFRNLKTKRGVLARNAVIAFVWLVSLLTFVFSYLHGNSLPHVPFLLIFALGTATISYCTLSVLHALIRPGPGEVSGNKRKVDQAKKRAYVSIAVIAGAMYVTYIITVTCIALHASSVLEYNEGCVVLMVSLFSCLPSSVSTPLLFLYRAGKLPCFSGWKGGNRSVKNTRFQSHAVMLQYLIFCQKTMLQQQLATAGRITQYQRRQGQVEVSKSSCQCDQKKSTCQQGSEIFDWNIWYCGGLHSVKKSAWSRRSNCCCGFKWW